MTFKFKLARYNDKAEELLGIKFKAEPWLHIAAVQIKSGDYSYAIYVWDTRKIVNSGHLNPKQVKVFEADELSPCLDNHTDVQGAPVAKAINEAFKTERDYDKGEQTGHEICGWYPEHIRIFPLKDEIYFVQGKRCKIEMYKKDKETYVFKFINTQNGSVYISASMKVKDDSRGGLAIAKAKLIRAFEIKPYMYPEEKAELGIESHTIINEDGIDVFAEVPNDAADDMAKKAYQNVSEYVDKCKADFDMPELFADNFCVNIVDPRNGKCKYIVCNLTGYNKLTKEQKASLAEAWQNFVNDLPN